MCAEHLNQDDIDALLKSQAIEENSQSTGQKENVPVPEQGITEGHSIAQPVEYSQLPIQTTQKTKNNIDIILDVNVEITAELGRKTMLIRDILEIGPGAVLELNKLAGEPVDLLVNNKLLARGEVVVINENFGVRIIDIVGQEQRIKNLK
ncbi:flagellar motor switch protein FliN [bacterium]|nr:flagellar motor switch protein FliN [bacterium]